jgi:acyl transferase domain-containing protein
MDPCERLLLEVAYGALSWAGYNKGKKAGTEGAFYGRGGAL